MRWYGIQENISAATYHADRLADVPTLSSSIAKVLLGRTPRHAWHAHPRLNPAFETGDDDKFDLGSAAHEIILGSGAGIDVCDFTDWRTKDAKAARETSRKAGRTPLLVHQYDRAMLVADAAWSHPHVPMFAEEGDAEAVLVWQDMGGPLCRAMLDWWSGDGLVVDIKTTEVALTDSSLARLIVNCGYDLSAAFYLRGLVALRPELAGRIKFRWLFVETTEPFGTRLIEADPMTLQIGDRKAGLAIAKWKRCLGAGVEAAHWPAWSPDIGRIETPPWSESQQIEREMTDPDAAYAVFTDTMPAYAPKRLMEAV